MSVLVESPVAVGPTDKAKATGDTTLRKEAGRVILESEPDTESRMTLCAVLLLIGGRRSPTLLDPVIRLSDIIRQ